MKRSVYIVKSKSYLFINILITSIAMACGPIGGDAEEGVSACEATQGNGTWSQQNGDAVKDGGGAVNELNVLGGLSQEGFNKSGGVIELQVQLKDTDDLPVYDGLTANEFSVESANFTFEPASTFVASNGKKIDSITVQDVSVTVPSELPPSVVLVFDSSGSTAATDPDRLRVKAAKSFVNQLPEASSVAVLDFGVAKDLFDQVISKCFEVSRFLLDFSTDRDEIKASISRVTSAGGTPLYAAIGDALKLVEGAKELGAEQVDIIVFTDGVAGDYEKSTASKIIKRANRNEAIIHTVALSIDDGEPENAVDIANLQRLSRDTNGISVTASKASELEDHFAGLAGGTASAAQVRVDLKVSPKESLSSGPWRLKGKLGVEYRGGSASVDVDIVIEVP